MEDQNTDREDELARLLEAFDERLANPEFSGGNDGLVRLWDVSSARPLETLVGNAGELSALAVSPDGKTLATGTYDTSIVKLFGLRSNSLLMNLHRVVDPVSTFAFAPDRRALIAVCSRPGFGKLLEWSLNVSARRWHASRQHEDSPATARSCPAAKPARTRRKLCSFH